MMRHTKLNKALYFLRFKSICDLSRNEHRRLERSVPVRLYARDGRVTRVPDNIRKKTSTKSTPPLSQTLNQIPPKSSRPNPDQDDTEECDEDPEQKPETYEKNERNEECVILPFSCPPPQLSPDMTSREIATTDDTLIPKKTECDFEPFKTPRNAQLDFSGICETSIQSGDKKDGIVSPTTSRDGNETRVEVSEKAPPPALGPPGGGRNYWLWGILAATAGGALLYYLFGRSRDENDKKGSSEELGRSSFRRNRREIIKFPATSTDFPKEVQYLLIGGGTAAFSAFRSIKSIDPKAQVLVISKEAEFPYMRPPLSKEIWNADSAMAEQLNFRQWNGSVRSIYYEPDSFYLDPKALANSSKGGVAVARGWTVTCIDPLKKCVTLDDGSSISYEKCLLAPGSKPKHLPILEEASDKVKDKVYYFRDIFDYRDLEREPGMDIAVIGGGLLGSELACSLTRRGKKVTIIYPETGLVSKMLPKYLSNWLAQQVETLGVKIFPESEVTGVSLHGDKLVLSISSGQKVEVDACAVAVGAEPDTDLAENSKLETHPKLGGYLVNSEMQARSNLYIAGDAACFFDEKFGRRRIENHDHAVVSGRLAGENMAGAGKPYLHQSMFWSDLSPDVGWEAVGVLDSSLRTVGVFAAAEEVELERPTDPAGKTEEQTTSHPPTPSTSAESFSKGVIFYLNQDGIIVGVLLWNVFNRMQLARQILKSEVKYEDLNEVAKLFSIHEG